MHSNTTNTSDNLAWLTADEQLAYVVRNALQAEQLAVLEVLEAGIVDDSDPRILMLGSLIYSLVPKNAEESLFGALLKRLTARRVRWMRSLVDAKSEGASDE